MSTLLAESIRSTMQALADGLYFILQDRLLGVYLGGSAAMGDFAPESSDLDFLVVTRGELSLEDAVAIKLLHQDLLRRYPDAVRLEGDYAPHEVLVPEGTTEPVPGCEKGKFLPKVGEIMLSADNIADMRDHGVSFFGPPPADLLPAVMPEQVRAAVRTMITEGLDPFDSPVEAAANLLNLVRSACSLECGRPVTKSEGAAWGLAHLGHEWHEPIAAALAVRSGQEEPGYADMIMSAVPALERWLRETYVTAGYAD
ncbi:MAG TPA: aminoglycoside adenylyltransferase domain-containing protein [Symbiobacteriaceae bacterium]|nr:aminoglycoside adenylyltransferase domain-containing protein [Symbiobacteriaceae bacterium]